MIKFIRHIVNAIMEHETQLLQLKWQAEYGHLKSPHK